MLLKEILKNRMEDRGLSNKELAHLIGVAPSLIGRYLRGEMPSERKLLALSQQLNFTIEEIGKQEDLSISVEEVSTMMGKPILFVRNAIKMGRLPGSYVESKGYTSFHIPRLAFYRYMGIEPRKEGETT